MMLACSSWHLLRKPPRQAFSSLVSSYLNKTTTSSIVRDDPRFFSSSSSTTPWLMLTPEIELSSGTDTVFKFYSLAKDKVISTGPRNVKAQLGLESEPKVDLECWGSSHGWLVLFDRRSSGMFLYNPLTSRHMKLPSIRRLVGFRKDDDLVDGSHHLTKLIISSPDPEGDASCRALMLHGFRGNLSFCCPNSSSDEWIETHHFYEDVAARCPDEDGDNFFVGINNPNLGRPEFGGWDLKYVSRPTFVDRLVEDCGDGPKKGWMGRYANYLVSDDANGGMYYVHLNSSGDPRLSGEWDNRFHVHKFDFESGGKLVYMDGSLDGLALFVGKSRCFALPAAEFPGLEPDSIYFTHLENYDRDPFGWKEMRAYNYRDRTFSRRFYIMNKNKNTGKPMWYTPTTT